MDSAEISPPKAREIVPTRNLVRSGLFAEVLRFQLDPVHDPTFGSAKHLEGEIPFLLPTIAMQNQFAELVAHPTTVDRIAQEIVANYRDFWPNKDDEEILATVSSLVVFGLLLIGPNPAHIDPAVVDMFVRVLVLSSAFDDVVDASDVTTFPGPDEYDFGEMIATLRAHDDFKPAHFPSGLAELKTLYRHYSVLQNFVKLAGNTEQNWLVIRDGFLQAMCAYHALYQLDRQECGEPRYSEETMFELHGTICGGKLGIEVLAIAKGAHLSPVIRADEVFQIAVNRAGDLISTQNAILGLQRDIQTREIDSVIMRSVVHKGAELQEGFDLCMRRIHALYNDYVVAKRQLLRFYKSNEPLKAYIHCMDTMIDGFLFVYVFMDRYGIRGNCQIVATTKFNTIQPNPDNSSGD